MLRCNLLVRAGRQRYGNLRARRQRFEGVVRGSTLRSVESRPSQGSHSVVFEQSIQGDLGCRRFRTASHPPNKIISVAELREHMRDAIFQFGQAAEFFALALRHFFLERVVEVDVVSLVDISRQDSGRLGLRVQIFIRGDKRDQGELPSQCVVPLNFRVRLPRLLVY